MNAEHYSHSSIRAPLSQRGEVTESAPDTLLRVAFGLKGGGKQPWGLCPGNAKLKPIVSKTMMCGIPRVDSGRLFIS